MTDPIYQKLKADAGVLLVDLWRTLRHQPLIQEWQQHSCVLPEFKDKQPTQTDPNPRRSHASGLCYFHLN